jgi:hypothetical protein
VSVLTAMSAVGGGAGGAGGGDGGGGGEGTVVVELTVVVVETVVVVVVGTVVVVVVVVGTVVVVVTVVVGLPGGPGGFLSGCIDAPVAAIADSPPTATQSSSATPPRAAWNIRLRLPSRTRRTPPVRPFAATPIPILSCASRLHNGAEDPDVWARVPPGQAHATRTLALVGAPIL